MGEGIIWRGECGEGKIDEECLSSWGKYFLPAQYPQLQEQQYFHRLLKASSLKQRVGGWRAGGLEAGGVVVFLLAASVGRL